MDHLGLTLSRLWFVSDPASHRLIGREHPIGVTRAFWRRFADRRRLHFTSRLDCYRPGEWSGELVAVLTL